MDALPVLKPLEKNDYPGLNTLFDKAFGTSRSLDTWAWKYQNNPHGTAIATVALVEQTEGDKLSDSDSSSLEKPKNEPSNPIVGFYGLVPRKVILTGKDMIAYQETDLMVDPKYAQGGLFKRLGRETYSRLMDQGHPFTFGFPNTTSLPAGKRILGWKAIEQIPLWTMLLKPSALQKALTLPGVSHSVDILMSLYNRTKLSSSWTGNIIESNEVDESFASALNGLPDPSGITFVRDLDYLIWRYQQCPEQTYTFFSARSADHQIRAAAVLSLDGAGRANLAEFIYAPGNDAAGTALLKHIAAYARKAACTTLRAWALAGSKEACFLADRGFFNRNAMNYHVIRSFWEPEFNRILYDARRWRLSSGDSDCV
ncbi:MAG: GNAT family N-acetyltransferase [bacterium]